MLNSKIIHELLILRDFVSEFVTSNDFLQTILEFNSVVEDEFLRFAFLVVNEMEVKLEEDKEEGLKKRKINFLPLTRTSSHDPHA